MRLAAPLLAILLSAFSAGAVMADDPHRDDNRRAARHHQDRSDHRPNDAAAKAVQQNGGGRALSSQPTDDGRYRVKVLKDGEVRIHTVDPNSEQNR